MAPRTKRKQATRGQTPTWPPWLWMAIGMLMGIALMGVVLVKGWAPLLRGADGPRPNAAATAPAEADAALVPETAEKPRRSYDFYQVLPEMEVVIPDAELSATARAEQTQREQTDSTSAPPTISDSNVRYVLQAGSYPAASAAEEAKAKLALSGFFAQVQPVTINGKTWHRVRLGPFASASELETSKRRLADLGINAIALKEGGGD